jgi:hypothetical protein
MIDPIIKRQLGYDPNLDEKELLKLWRRRIRLVCKPCWELKYCPYGPLVEQFPAFPITRDEGVDHHEFLISQMKKGIIKGKERRKTVQMMIDTFDPSDYPIEFPPKIILESYCTQFSHICPVFFVREIFTETKDTRRTDSTISRPTMIKVVRRDNSQCQKCGKILKDDEIEFDHIIPVSKGGSDEVQNVRVTCLDCNRKKSNKIEILDERNVVDRLREGYGKRASNHQ